MIFAVKLWKSSTSEFYRLITVKITVKIYINVYLVVLKLCISPLIYEKSMLKL